MITVRRPAARLDLRKPASSSVSSLRLVLREGRFHQVKRMMAVLGRVVLRLHRERIGGLTLPADLAEGAARPLTADEVALLAALLLGVPSAAEIAEMVRRKPIGRVLEDICRDIGLEPADPGWNDLVFALCAHGGDIDRVFDEYAERTVDMDQPTAEEIADWSETINYEVTTRVSALLPRRVI